MDAEQILAAGVLLEAIEDAGALGLGWLIELAAADPGGAAAVVVFAGEMLFVEEVEHPLADG